MDTKKLRQKILDLAIRGKLVPQDPNDEPASVLLKRIREEKERLIKDGKIKRDKKEKTGDKIHYENVPFEVPEGWVWCRLGDIAQHNTGKTLDKNRNTGTLQEYITTSNLYWGYFDFTELRKMPIEDSELERCTATIGDLLICEGGDAGRSAVWKSEQSICFQNHIHRVRPFAKIRTSFLYYFMQLIYLNGDIKQYLKGVGIQSLSGNALASIIIPIPPLQEQQRIVQKIEESFTFIDQIEENKLSLEQFIKQSKSKVLDLAIRGKLVPQDPNDEPASMLLEKIGNEQKTKKNSCDNLHYPFEVPEGWVWCRLGNIGTTNIGLTYKPLDICVDGVPVLRSNNIVDGKLNFSDLVRVKTPFGKSLELQENDILICARNGSRHLVGKCALTPNFSERVTFGAFMAMYRSSFNHFVYYFLNSDFFRKIFDSEGISTQINQLTQAMIKDTLIPLPPLAEQQRIVSTIEQIFTQLDEIEKSLN